MTATIYALFVLMNYPDIFMDFRSMKFESIDQCESVRATLKITQPEVFKRSFCGTLTRTFKEDEKDIVEKPPEEPKKEECTIKEGFAAGKPCLKA